MSEKILILCRAIDSDLIKKVINESRKDIDVCLTDIESYGDKLARQARNDVDLVIAYNLHKDIIGNEVIVKNKDQLISILNDDLCIINNDIFYKYKNSLDNIEFTAQLKDVISDIRSNEDGYLTYDFIHANNPYVATLELDAKELSVIIERQAKHIKSKENTFHLENFDLQDPQSLPKKNQILINGKCVYNETISEVDKISQNRAVINELSSVLGIKINSFRQGDARSEDIKLCLQSILENRPRQDFRSANKLYDEILNQLRLFKLLQEDLEKSFIKPSKKQSFPKIEDFNERLFKLSFYLTDTKSKPIQDMINDISTKHLQILYENGSLYNFGTDNSIIDSNKYGPFYVWKAYMQIKNDAEIKKILNTEGYISSSAISGLINHLKEYKQNIENGIKTCKGELLIDKVSIEYLRTFLLLLDNTERELTSTFSVQQYQAELSHHGITDLSKFFYKKEDEYLSDFVSAVSELKNSPPIDILKNNLESAMGYDNKLEIKKLKILIRLKKIIDNTSHRSDHDKNNENWNNTISIPQNLSIDEMAQRMSVKKYDLIKFIDLDSYRKRGDLYTINIIMNSAIILLFNNKSLENLHVMLSKNEDNIRKMSEELLYEYNNKYGKDISKAAKNSEYNRKAVALKELIIGGEAISVAISYKKSQKEVSYQLEK